MTQTTETMPALKARPGTHAICCCMASATSSVRAFTCWWGEVGGAAGYQAPFAFILAALIAGASGLSYGELSRPLSDQRRRSGILI